MPRNGVNIDLAYDDITRPKWYERLRWSDKWDVYIKDCNAQDISPDWRRPSQDEQLALVNVKFAARIANRLLK